jgi:hypothetical protein
MVRKMTSSNTAFPSTCHRRFAALLPAIIW